MSARHFTANEDDSQASPTTEAETQAAPSTDEVVQPVKPVEIDTSGSNKEIYGLVNKKSNRHHHRRRRRRSSSRRRNKATPIIGGVIVVVFLLLCVGAAWLASIDRSMSMGDEQDALVAALKSTEEIAQEDEVNDGFYVLLVGSDAREGDTASRGDVLMLARIDPTDYQVTLVSIPRDTMVNISGAVGTQKINATYAYGGPSEAVYEVSKFCGVPIRHYVEIDFAGLEQVVNLLGGVWVDVPESVYLGQTTGGYLEAGPQMLDGATALAYARERYNATGSDFGRAQAQRLIVQAIIRQTMQASPLELPGLVKSLASCVKTDYAVSDLVSLAMAFQGHKITIYQASCPSYALWQDGVSYVGTMFDEWRDMMKRVDAGLDPNDTSVEIPEPYASSTTLGQATNSAAPTDYHDLAESSLNTDATAPAATVTEIESAG